MNHSITIELVRELHAAEVVKHQRDNRSHGSLSVEEAMVRATRTKVHELLQEQVPIPPLPPVFDADDPDEVYFHQKQHGKRLWQETDKLMLEAGFK